MITSNPFLCRVLCVMETRTMKAPQLRLQKCNPGENCFPKLKKKNFPRDYTALFAFFKFWFLKANQSLLKSPGSIIRVLVFIWIFFACIFRSCRVWRIGHFWSGTFEETSGVYMSKLWKKPCCKQICSSFRKVHGNGKK